MGPGGTRHMLQAGTDVDIVNTQYGPGGSEGVDSNQKLGYAVLTAIMIMLLHNNS